MAISFLSLLLIGLLFSSPAKAQDIDVKIYPLDSLSKIASYKGGMLEMYKYLQANLQYPKEAQNNKVQGKVYISFVVEKNGELTDLKVENGPGSGLNEEALRVVKLCPAWDPGLRKGLPVRSNYTMPVAFRL